MAQVRSKLRARLESESDAELRSMTSPLRRGRFEPEAIELAREILAERGASPAEPERCPRCGGTSLETGDARVHGTLPGFLVFGLSLQHLWFRPDGGGREELVQRSLARRSAILCRDCGTLILEG